jgi:hypothetical protein
MIEPGTLPKLQSEIHPLSNFVEMLRGEGLVFVCPRCSKKHLMRWPITCCSLRWFAAYDDDDVTVQEASP